MRRPRGILGSAMARPVRIEYPGAVYHLTSRGNERKAIFRADADRQAARPSLLGRAIAHNRESTSRGRIFHSDAVRRGYPARLAGSPGRPLTPLCWITRSMARHWLMKPQGT